MILPYPEMNNKDFYGLFIDLIYNSTKNTVIVLGIIIFLTPGIVTQEKYIHLFLGNKIVRFFSNLVYCISLIHTIILEYFAKNIRTDIKLSNWNIIYYSFKTFFYATIFSLIIHVIVEKSFIKLEQRNILGLKSKIKNKNDIKVIVY